MEEFGEALLVMFADSTAGVDGMAEPAIDTEAQHMQEPSPALSMHFLREIS